MNFFDLFKKQQKLENHSSSSATESSSATDQTEEPVKNNQAEQANEATKEPAKEGSQKVFNLIILDESGSMQSIYRPALSGVNETLQTIRESDKEHQDQSHFVSLITFDTGHYKEIYKCTPAASAVDITEDDYAPCGGTPLYDAMGRAINDLRTKVSENDVVLVTVITDGYENASREYIGKAIKSLVEEMRGKGWVFTYIGANQDVEAVAESMSINNRMAFSADESGTKAMFEKELKSRKRFFSRIQCDRKSTDISEDYFI